MYTYTLNQLRESLHQCYRCSYLYKHVSAAANTAAATAAATTAATANAATADHQTLKHVVAADRCLSSCAHLLSAVLLRP
jgi:ABC-type polar amino acid transport system ATPase subunit